jgi:hypothetical protein
MFHHPPFHASRDDARALVRASPSHTFQIYNELNGDTAKTDLPFSAQSLEVARVMNAVPLLTELTALERAGEMHTLAFMQLRQSLASLFGGTALCAGSKQQFTHERNLLGELWQDPAQTSVSSPTIWRFLRKHRADGSRTIREEILQAWRQQGRLGEPGSSGEQQRSALVFGQGGMYTSPDLRARASMLETLEAHVQLLSEELEVFLREIIQRRV